MLNKGVILSERYEIIERIGTGGMADVYRAIDHKLNRYVAIKVLKKEYSDDKQFVAKFRSEARSAAVLNNPNIVSVYDVGNDDNTYYIVLELIEGITLKKYIERKGHLQYKEAVSIAIQIANGMEAAHEHHIVHRDIKPQNIIISKDGKVKVTDFGIARVATSTTTVASNAMGSVHYMSPEQARGGYLDERSDIYSFGITLFEMLTGQVPFDGDTTVAVAVHHIQDELEPPSEFISGIPISVDKIVQKCTNKKQDLRYQSVSDLVSDLKKSLIMPDVDFVQDPSAFAGAVTVNGAENTDGTETKLVDTDKAKEAADKEHDIVDIDDEDNEKLNGVMKWVGIGIAAAIIIAIIIVLVVMSSSGMLGKKEETTEAVTTELQATIEVPNVKGGTLAQARQTLTTAGFMVKVAYDDESNEAEGTVVDQSVQAGSKVAKGSLITITVSGTNPNAETTTEKPTETTTQEASIKVPYVIGRIQSEAQSEITGLGLGYHEIGDYSDSVPAGNVISQSPESGTNLKKGQTVTVVISLGKKEPETTKPAEPDSGTGGGGSENSGAGGGGSENSGAGDGDEEGHSED